MKIILEGTWAWAVVVPILVGMWLELTSFAEALPICLVFPSRVLWQVPAVESIDQQQDAASTVNSPSFDQWQDEQPVSGPGRKAAAVATAGGDSRISTDAYGAGEVLGFGAGDQTRLRRRQAKPPSAAAGPSYGRPSPNSSTRILRSRTPPPPPPQDWMHREGRVHPPALYP